jgi:hypothetical protein
MQLLGKRLGKGTFPTRGMSINGNNNLHVEILFSAGKGSPLFCFGNPSTRNAYKSVVCM